MSIKVLEFKEWWILNNRVEGECNCNIGKYFNSMIKIKNDEYKESIDGYNSYLKETTLKNYQEKKEELYYAF